MISHGNGMCDTIAQNATTKSHRQGARFPYLRNMEPVTTRLKALRESAEPKVSLRGIAKALDMPTGTYAAYEDPKKYKKPILPLDLAKRIADVLVENGVPRSEVLKLAGVDGSLTPSPRTGSVRIWVIGRVEAGAWREGTEWSEEERYQIEVGPSPWPGVERYALEVVGYSMDKLFQPGAILEYLKLAGNRSGLRAQPGDLVIAQRRDGALYETTCKRLNMAEDGSFYLTAESNRPEFQEPIHIGKPDGDWHLDSGIEIIGIVVRSHMFHFRRGG